MTREYTVGDSYFDDESLSEFTADPASWSEEDLATAQLLLAQQKAVLDDTHPGHKKELKRLRQLVAQLERAIRQHNDAASAHQP